MSKSSEAEKKTVATVLYLDGSKSEHEENLIESKADLLLPLVQELADPNIQHQTEIWAVILHNNQSGLGAIIAMHDDREQAQTDAEITYSALHEIHVPFPWAVRVSKLTLQA